jgi:hypothetical protein
LKGRSRGFKSGVRGGRSTVHASGVGELEGDGGVGFEHVAAFFAVGAGGDEFDGVVFGDFVDEGVADAVGGFGVEIAFGEEEVEGFGGVTFIEVVFEDGFAGGLEIFEVEAAGGFEFSGEPEAGAHDGGENKERDDDLTGGGGGFFGGVHGMGGR